jgi:hypothetical protein
MAMMQPNRHPMAKQHNPTIRTAHKTKQQHRTPTPTQQQRRNSHSNNTQQHRITATAQQHFTTTSHTSTAPLQPHSSNGARQR